MMRPTGSARTVHFRLVANAKRKRLLRSLRANNQFCALAYFYCVVGDMFVVRSPLSVAVPTAVAPLSVREHIQKSQLTKQEPYSFRRSTRELCTPLSFLGKPLNNPFRPRRFQQNARPP
jgi:hypothetical protein